MSSLPTIACVLLFICSHLTEQTDAQDTIDKIIESEGWKSFGDVEIIDENGKRSLFFAFKNPDESKRLPLEMKHLIQFISCKYAYILLNYTKLVDYLSKSCNDRQLSGFMKTECVSRAEVWALNGFVKTNFMQAAITYLENENGENESFLQLTLQNFYSRSQLERGNKRTLALSYQHSSPFNVLKKSFDRIFKNFCSKTQTPPIPEYSELINEYNASGRQTVFFQFIEGYIRNYMSDSKTKYYEKLGFYEENREIFLR